MSAPCLTLLTDFGLRDGYVGAMKGAILSRCPQVRLVDLTHEIAPGDVSAAAYVLRQAAPYFPAGTVHCVVVDPGVGSERRAVACEIAGHYFVAPDNGVLALVLELHTPKRAHALSRPELWAPEPSAVFHGRDIFGPVAAHLAGGGALETVGNPIDSVTLARRIWPAPRREGQFWIGEVVHVDRFGNLITNLVCEAGIHGDVEIAGRSIALARTYSDVLAGELVALCGSSGWLEIARNGGSAAELLGATRGLVVTFHPRR